MTRTPHVVLLDNHDSFVYNLVDALADHPTTVFRNTVDVDTILDADPDLICLSPGPGHPLDAGSMMDLIAAAITRIPILGICLGFQALLEHHGATVRPCGPVHGRSVPMTLTPAGIDHPIFHGLATDWEPDRPDIPGTQIPVARYHSLGCTDAPASLRTLAVTDTDIGPVVMAAETLDRTAIGMQFHPESILSPTGPLMLQRCIDALCAPDPA
ncbi:anthranilate synthase component II [Actinomyces sp. B33]|uniref:anthranilate synthase component II n=1 Tax=Actinomyces sp. B33 TaxID=2942131 RepID=UPI00233FC9DB|nr:anthranilate synthase component II [Actinomyces sp. B33]MDC4233986.1 anthranilate synthase component II [Actinomyces sp. B33]